MLKTGLMSTGRPLSLATAPCTRTRWAIMLVPSPTCSTRRSAFSSTVRAARTAPLQGRQALFRTGGCSPTWWPLKPRCGCIGCFAVFLVCAWWKSIYSPLLPLQWPDVSMSTLSYPVWHGSGLIFRTLFWTGIHRAIIHSSLFLWSLIKLHPTSLFPLERDGRKEKNSRGKTLNNGMDTMYTPLSLNCCHVFTISCLI